MAMMKGSRAKAHGKGKVRRMVIEPAQNGYMSTTEHHPSPGAKGMEMYSDRQDTKAVHPSISHLKKHVGNVFAPGGPAAQDEDEYAEQTPPAV